MLGIRLVRRAVRSGERARLRQTGLFDRGWYLWRYPDVEAAGVDPLEHYLQFGAGEGRDPNAFFDAEWYASQASQVAGGTRSPIAHYLEAGRANGLDPSPFFQTRYYEERSPAGDHQLGRDALASFVAELPRPARLSTAPRAVVYTAIFGQYDHPPVVSDPDPALHYILFTDQPNPEPCPPWEVRVVPRIFEDPQLDARRVKVLPHLFLPNHDLSLWMDASFRLTRLRYADLTRLAGHAPIALLPHEERRCIYAEADAVVHYGLDSPGRVRRQMDDYAGIGFPTQAGLHATGFLVRRHLDIECVRFDTLWWEQVSQHSKRDQLSFDFVRWLTAAPVLTLPFRYTRNAVFTWGGHQTTQRRASEHLAHATRSQGASSSILVPDYDPRFERWPPGFIASLHKLNSVVHAAGERVEGNLCYFDSAPDYLHAPPDPRNGRRRENFLRALAGRARVLELGFNAGHSALLALSHSSVHFTAIDMATHGYMERAAAHLAKEFGGRFRFIRMDSRAIYDRRAELELASFDLVHVDGGHGDDVYANDILSVLHLCTPGTRVLIDDFYVHGITAMTQRLVKDGFLEPYGDLGSQESAAFTIVKAFPVGAGQSLSALVKDFQLSTVTPVGGVHSASSFGSESSSA